MSKHKLRFALVGCGDFGKEFGRYLLEVAEIVALCDADAPRAAQTAETLGLDVPVESDYRRVLARDDVDAVAITAANFVHARIAVAAAQAGIHVYCEKAMARNVAECWQMVRASQQNNVRLMVGHKRRLRPAWLRMIELTRPGAPLGEPIAITVTQYADMRPNEYPGTWWADPQRSGGAFAVYGVHVIDWFRAMCGDVRRVSAIYGPQINEGYKFHDVMHTTYVFESGALATINTSFEYPLHKFRESQGPMVQCRHGGLRLAPHMDSIDLYWQRLDASEAHRETYDIAAEFDPAFRREAGDFVRWVTDGAAPCLTWVEGLRCVELMEAAYHSADRNGTWVDLPLYPELED